MTEVAKSEVSLMKDELEDLKTEASRAEAQRTQLWKEHEAHGTSIGACSAIS